MSITAHDTRPATPSALLRSLIDGGTLKNQVEPWVDSHVRRPDDSWYAQLAAQNGVDAAESALAAWVAKQGLNAFADSVSTVASGLLALATLDNNRPLPDKNDGGGNRRQEPEPSHVRLVPLTEKMCLPGTHLYGNGTLILGTNPHVSGCGCIQPEGSGVFGRGGQIGLRFIGLAVDERLTEVTLLLFLPHPKYQENHDRRDRPGFAVIGISTNGQTHGRAVEFGFCADPVEYGLGLTDRDNMISGSFVASGIDAALRFPGSGKYLARHIPDLGTYLEAAAKLTGQHTH